MTLDLFVDRFSHLFWVDASSEESMELSLKGISSLSAAQHSGADGSVQSVLQWISFLQDEWLIVFDNAVMLLLQKWWKSSFLQVLEVIF